MRIGLDARNLVLEEGTGIATYARNLSGVVRELGHSGEILYEFKRQGEAPILDEISLFAPQYARGYFAKRPFIAASALLQGLFGGITPEKLEIGDFVVSRGLSSRLPEFDAIWTAFLVFNKAWFYFSLTGRFMRVNFAPPPDIMHWTLPYPVYVPGCKNIYTIHDVIPLRLPYTTSDDRKSYFHLIKETVRHADHIVAVSNTTKEDLLRVTPEAEKKLTVTFQSVKLPADVLATGQEGENEKYVRNLLGLKFREYFLFVSAIEPKKNVARLIEAFLRSNSKFPLIIVGRRGWLFEKELAPLAYQEVLPQLEPEIRHRRRVILIGYLEFRNLMAVISSARAILFPSLYEGFGLPIIEAMQLGVPVMTSDFGSMLEVAGDAAMLVDPYDVNAMRQTIERLAEDDSLCARLAEAGTRRATTFSWDRFKSVMGEVYDAVGGSRRMPV